ncbi:hypothetical protein ATANTOWER_027066 [Ataeniobius toweri]|uniref:Uncharacterized protein n=1 Tax=Ataeniobius toweri TaxID=208326 RepID=A0ABU7BCU2_9TELE|nr:hypothetical protein [Ataeniobius toweri]
MILLTFSLEVKLHEIQIFHTLTLQQHPWVLTNISLFIYHTNLSLPHITTLQISSLTSCPKHNMKLSFWMLTLSSLPTPFCQGSNEGRELCFQTRTADTRHHVSVQRCQLIYDLTYLQGVREVKKKPINKIRS